MLNRAFLFACFLAVVAVGSGAFAQSSPQSTRDKAAQVKRIEFYLAHGEPGACGPNCDEWIAAEGKIDAIAFDRLRQLLDNLGPGRKPPIFFNSPGGSVNGSLALGRLIHEKKLETSVGHTIPLGCDTDKPDKLQACSSAQSGVDKPVQYEISQFMAQCNSGCVYALAGGVTHQVPPWVKVGIHDAGLDPDAVLPHGAVPAFGILDAHRRIAVFLREMKIDPALFETILATPFEMPRFLERDDIVRFGIDPRQFGETAWRFANTTPPKILKKFFVRTDAEPSHYINGVLEVSCKAPSSMSVLMAREPLASDIDFALAAPDVVNLDLGGKQIPLKRGTSPKFYVRGTTVTSLDGATEKPIELPGTEFGRKEGNPVTLNMDGFLAAYAKLRQHCVPQNGLQALVQQFQANPARYGFPKPGAGQTTTQNPLWTTAVAPANKQPSTIEFSRFATPEQKLRIDFLFLLKLDCSSAGKDAVNVVEQPQHGTLSIETSKGLSDFSAKDPRAACNTHDSDAVAVFYEANKDYEGQDSASVSITPPVGGAVTHHYTIRVK